MTQYGLSKVNVRRIKFLVPFIIYVFYIVGCGGGENSPTEDDSIVYRGNVQPALITTNNASVLVANIISNNPSVLNVAGTRNFSHILASSLDGFSYWQMSEAPFDIINSCENGGTTNLLGSVEGMKELKFTLILRNCAIKGIIMSGIAEVNVVDKLFVELRDSTISFTHLTILVDGNTLSSSGTIRSEFSYRVIDYATNLETLILTINIVVKDSVDGKYIKFENIVVKDEVENGFHSQTINGRVYDSEHGYVDIKNVVPLGYRYEFPEYPDIGGQLILIGSNTTTLVLTPDITTPLALATDLTLELNIDSENSQAFVSKIPWALLNQVPTNGNTRPVANIDSNVNISRSVETFLNGSKSHDPDYDFISFTWEILRKPEGSQASLKNAKSMTPLFNADLLGEYEISLVVNDGQTNSTTDSSIFVAVNNAPVANAGSNLYAAVNTSINIDGSGSKDINNDLLSHRWSIVSQPSESIVTLEDEINVNASFSADTTGLYEIQLIVNDGLLNSTADSLKIRVEAGDLLACNEENLTKVNDSGSIVINTSTDFVPLCNGWLLLGDRVDNIIRRFNPISGEEGDSYLLKNSPDNLELDPDNAMLYVAQPPATSLVKINLIDNTQSTINLSASVTDLALGNNGFIFAALDDVSTWPQRSLSIVNGLEGKVGKVLIGNYGERIAYDRPGLQLVSSSNVSRLSRFSVDETNMDLSLLQDIIYRNGRFLAMSPDGDHIAYSASSYNSILDISSSNLETIYGSWDTTDVPQAFVFDPFGEYIAIIDSTKINVFSVDRHVLVKTFPNDFSDCAYSDNTVVRFSRSGRIVFAYVSCGLNKSYGKLFWVVFEP